MYIYPALISKENAAINFLLRLQCSIDLIERIAATVSITIMQALDQTCDFEQELSRADPRTIPQFTTFVQETIARANIPVRVILVTLTYVRRIAPLLHLPTERYARERIFIGAIVLANKYTNDSSIRNQEWAKCTRMFSPRDVGRMEREFLDVIDYDLSVTETDLVALYDALLCPLISTAHQCPSRWPYLSLEGYGSDGEDIDFDVSSEDEQGEEAMIHPSQSSTGTFGNHSEFLGRPANLSHDCSKYSSSSGVHKSASKMATNCMRSIPRPPLIQRF